MTEYFIWKLDFEMIDNYRENSRNHPQDRKTQTGSVIEFMFVDRGYLATSYPYPPTKERQEKRYIAKEGLPDDMEEFLEEGNHAYIINASANAYNCWIFVYWTKLGEYDERYGGEISEYPEIKQRLHDFQDKSRGKVRSTAFGSGKETVFLRASNGQHHWSFRWKDLPFSCEMIIQDSIQQNGWKDRRIAIEGKKLERTEYYGPNPVEGSLGENDDANKRAAGCIRFLTLGKNDAWIIYGETWHIWDKSKNKLPKLLLKGLEMGMKYQWIINKVELSLFNEVEYVLIYDEGPIFYNILSPTFVDEFKKVVKQWAESKGVDVFYNEDVLPEKIRHNRNLQRYLVPLNDDESTTSHSTHPSSADGTILEYTERPREPFPAVKDESAFRYHDVESTPQRTVSQDRPPISHVKTITDALNTTSPVLSHRRDGSDNSTGATRDQRHRGANGMKSYILGKLNPGKSSP